MTTVRRTALVCLLSALTVAGGWSVPVLLGQAPALLGAGADPRPVAHAGLNHTIEGIGIVVELDGRKSSDLAGLPLSYRWTVADAPAGSAATLSGADTATPTFVPDRKGRYLVQLVVDNGLRASRPDGVTITVRNTPPVANAGSDQVAAVGDTVRLDGTASSDADGDALTFHWAFQSRPRGSHATFADPSLAAPAFLVDKPGRYIARLTVRDGQARGTDIVFIDVPNTAPVANAGQDQSVAVGATVLLDGSASTDADGDRLRYTWTLVSRPAGSAARLVGRRSVRPSVVVDVPGQYVISLAVNDGRVDSAPDTVILSTGNTAPVANAGPDQTAVVTQVVSLNGAGSSDADGDPLTYAWTFVSRPAGSAAALSDPTAVTPTFTVDRRGLYRLALVVHDGHTSSSPDVVDISVGNTMPVAAAGVDQRINVGATVTLDGSGSTDVDGDLLTYMWSLTSVPDGSTAALSGAAAVTPTFVADLPGTYIAQLIVSDGSVLSAADTVRITTENLAPIANAGAGQTAHVGQFVVLDGSGSMDPDGDALTFSWSFSVRPAGSTATLDAATTTSPSFIPDRPGDYVVQLIVSDGVLPSAPATATISTVNSIPVARAGADQIGVPVGAVVLLTGSASSDADGQPLTYRWSLLARPAGSAAVLSDPSAVDPSFTADVAGDYVAQLVVNDGVVDGAPDTVLIRTELPPIANAGPDQSHPAGTTVTLDGSGSSDPGGHAITYSWAFTDAPAGSTAVLTSASTVAPSFVADRAGVFVVQLTVTNTQGGSSTDTVSVTVGEVTPVVTVAATDPAASETGGDTGTFTITRTGSLAATLDVSYVLGGTATGSDYTVPSADTATIPASEAAVTVTVTPVPDAEAEGPETVTLTLVDAPAYDLGTEITDTITISDTAAETPLVTVVATDAEATEPGLDNGVFTVTRTGPVSAALAVTLSVGGTAASGIDYVGAGLGVTIPAGASSASVAIAPLDDAEVEGAETVVLTLVDGVAYDLGAPASATVTIADQSVPVVTVAASDAAASEVGPDAGTFTVTRAGGATALPLAVQFTIGGTATASDYAPVGVSANFGAGQLTTAVTVTPVTDAEVEGDETVLFTLTDGAHYDLGTPASATVTIADGPVSGGGSLINGFLHTGTIAAAGEVDTWTFDAVAGDRIAVHVGEIVDDNDFRPWIRLLSPTDVSLGSAFGLGAAAIGDVLAPVTGTYRVLVASADSGLDGTGTYRITMTHSPGPVTVALGDEGGPLTSGAVHLGAVLRGDLDVWTFTATAGERLTAHVGETSETDDFRPWIRIWTPAGGTVGSAFGVAAAEIGDVIAPVTGTYLVLVASADSGVDGTGTYRLTLAHSSGSVVVSAGDQGGPLVNGALHTGEIVRGDLDVWTFTATAGDRIAAFVGEISETDDFRPWIRIWTPAGGTLGSAFGVAAAEIGDVIAPVTGTYLVLVASADSGVDGTGTYRLTIARTPGPITVSPGDEGGPLTNGGLHTGEIVRGDLDVWTFTATAGDRIAAFVGEIGETDDFRPWIRISTPTGGTLGSAFGVAAAEIGDAIAPVTGTYLVLVASADSGVDGTGTYRLTVTHTPGPITVSTDDQGGPLAIGAPNAGEILRGDLDVWTFTATAGSRFTIHIDETSEADDLRPWIRVWTPSGGTLGSAFGLTTAQITNVAAPVTGTYLVVVASADSGVDGVGTYSLTVTPTAAAVATAATTTDPSAAEAVAAAENTSAPSTAAAGSDSGTRAVAGAGDGVSGSQWGGELDAHLAPRRALPVTRAELSDLTHVPSRRKDART
jgi:hypothetical protein